MNSAFDVNRYWLERGRNYIDEPLPHDFHRLQESFLLGILRASQMPLGRILELGCGFGRITRILSEAFSSALITALDLSPEQLENARRNCSENPRITFQSFDFYSGAPLPGTSYDAAFAIEVFLHHPEPMVRNLIEKLRDRVGHIVSIDWSEEWPWKTPEHVWVHDYLRLYSEAGLQCAAFVLPQKIEGQQQKLFIAARELAPSILRLKASLSAGQDNNPNHFETESERALPKAANWLQQLELALEEIRQTIKSNTAFILVNDEQWGSGQAGLSEYHVLPFLEREGIYWGAPANDEVAMHELERLRSAGARYIVFAWTSFWWLDHYSGFHRHLTTTWKLVLQNERLIIFASS